MKKNIETGQRFGRLVIVKEVEHHKMPSGRYRRMFLCKCDCGNEVTCSLANLTSGNTSSCGCFKKETASKNNSTHRQSKTRLYRCWQHMKHRCEVRLKCLRWQLGTNKDPYQVYLIDNCNKNKCKEFIKSE